MNHPMKQKYFLSAACLCLCAELAFTSCNKDDDGPEASPIESITATVENGSSYDLDQVKALIYYENGIDEVVSGKYTNGGFTLALPKTIDAKYLELIFEEKELKDGMKVSDPNVKITLLDRIEGYKSGDRVGTFMYIKEPSASSETEGTVVYTDRDVVITGSVTLSGYTEVMNISLKKGWNMMYYTETATEMTTSTSDPGGLKWVFYQYGDNGDHAEDPIPEQESIAKFSGSKKFPFKGLLIHSASLFCYRPIRATNCASPRSNRANRRTFMSDISLNIISNYPIMLRKCPYALSHSATSCGRYVSVSTELRTTLRISASESR
jgi:hypothetical protein